MNAARGRLPVHWYRFLCSATQAAEQVLRSHAGQRYLTASLLQLTHVCTEELPPMVPPCTTASSELAVTGFTVSGGDI